MTKNDDRTFSEYCQESYIDLTIPYDGSILCGGVQSLQQCLVANILLET